MSRIKVNVGAVGLFQLLEYWKVNHRRGFLKLSFCSGQHYRKTGELISLSEQQLLDCDDSEDACDGGDEEQALEYIKSQGGLDTEESYPYKGYQGSCKFSSGNVGAKDTGLVQIQYGSEDDLKHAVATVVCIFQAWLNYDF